MTLQPAGDPAAQCPQAASQICRSPGRLHETPAGGPIPGQRGPLVRTLLHGHVRVRCHRRAGGAHRPLVFTHRPLIEGQERGGGERTIRSTDGLCIRDARPCMDGDVPGSQRCCHAGKRQWRKLQRQHAVLGTSDRFRSRACRVWAPRGTEAAVTNKGACKRGCLTRMPMHERKELDTGRVGGAVAPKAGAPHLGSLCSPAGSSRRHEHVQIGVRQILECVAHVCLSRDHGDEGSAHSGGRDMHVRRMPRCRWTIRRR